MTDPMTPSPMPSEERHATTYRVIIGGLPERSLAEGIQRVLQGDDSPPFMTFAIEAEPLTREAGLPPEAEDRSLPKKENAMTKPFRTAPMKDGIRYDSKGEPVTTKHIPDVDRCTPRCFDDPDEAHRVVMRAASEDRSLPGDADNG